MHIAAKHQSHMNIVDSRKAAVKKMTRRTGLTFSMNEKKTPKSHVVFAINAGYLDGWFYQVNYDEQTVKIMSHDNRFLNTHFVFKIGN